jgi:uncharacterized lipoprotein YajG
MITVRMTVLAVAACLLAGCARVGTTQTGCEQSTQTFPEMTACLKTVVDRTFTPRPQYDPALSLYFAKVVQLSERVRIDQISDFDARAELQRNYVTLMDKKAAR